jgi:fructokinase
MAVLEQPPAGERLTAMRFSVIGEALADLVQARSDGRFTGHAGGSPYNVAITLGRLGEPVELIAQCGSDGFGELLTAKLRQSGVLLDSWRTLPLPTSVAVANLDGRGQARYSFYLEGTAAPAFAAPATLPRDSILHAGSIASWLPPAAATVHQTLAKARTSGATLISYDPNVRPGLMADRAGTSAAIEHCIGLAHVVKASDEDVATLYGGRSVDDVAAGWCARGASLVVVTLGSAGAVAYGPHGELARQAAAPIDVVDTVGAGDSFAGGLLSALAAAGLARPAELVQAVQNRDQRIGAALRTAVAVSALTCGRAGADPPMRTEVDAFLAAMV